VLWNAIAGEFDDLSPEVYKDVYVVWVETPGGRTFNLGRLMVAKDRRGTLKTTTSLEEFRLLVSAEYLSAANASSPGTFPILVTDFFRVK
jgi:hypothetical protein